MHGFNNFYFKLDVHGHMNLYQKSHAAIWVQVGLPCSNAHAIANACSRLSFHVFYLMILFICYESV